MGVGGVLIRDGRVLLIRRGGPPLEGEWSLPGGMLELSETLEEGVLRELHEETGMQVRVLALVEVFERIIRDDNDRTKYHFVIADYLCEAGERRSARSQRRNSRSLGKRRRTRAIRADADRNARNHESICDDARLNFPPHARTFVRSVSRRAK